jgi:hypothetical protein
MNRISVFAIIFACISSLVPFHFVIANEIDSQSEAAEEVLESFVEDDC